MNIITMLQSNLKTCNIQLKVTASQQIVTFIAETRESIETQREQINRELKSRKRE